MRWTQTIASGTAQANTGQTTRVSVPGWATGAIFYLNLTAVAGTTPLMDFDLNEVDPIDGTSTTPLEGWDGITQLAAADLITVRVGPHRSSADDTGVDYHVPTILGPLLDAVITLDRTTGDETYTYTLSVTWVD